MKSDLKYLILLLAAIIMFSLPMMGIVTPEYAVELLSTLDLGELPRGEL